MIDEYFTVQNTTASTGDYLVRFIDWDGTILKSELVNSGGTATPPSNPTHEKAIFYDWNASFSNIQQDKDIGAIYDTISGHTYMYITLTSGSTLTGYTGIDPVIYLKKLTIDELNVYNDETNTLIGTNSSSGNTTINLAGQFAAGVGVNDYILRLECAGDYQFGDGTNLKPVFLSQTYRFALTKILIGSGKGIGLGYAFYNQRMLESVMFPKATTTVYGNSFQTTGLKSLILPSGCTTINTYGFQNCTNLKIVSIPNVSSFGTYCFDTCTTLKKVVLKPTLNSIGQFVFQNCDLLQDIKLPPTVTSVSANVFQGDGSIKTMNFPSGITTISANLLSYGCINLQSVTLSSEVTSISAGAFFGASNLNEVIIYATTPPTLASIDAFDSFPWHLKIKVPFESVADYRAATNWSNPRLVDHIVGLPYSGVFEASANNDTLISSLYPTRNFGISTYFLRWIEATTCKGLISFDLSSISSGATCTSATLYTYMAVPGQSSTMSLNIYSVAVGNGDWTEGTKDDQVSGLGDTNWNYKSGTTNAWAGSSGLTIVDIDYEPTVLGTINGNQADIAGTQYISSLNTTRIQGWFGEVNTNYGLVIPITGTCGRIASSEHATSFYRPKLVITYNL